MLAVYRVKKTCRTFDERRDGMMNDTLADGEVCVFVYGHPHSPRFWCKDTPQDLFVSLVSENVVVDCKQMTAYDETPVTLCGAGSIAIESLEALPIGSNAIVTNGEVWVGDAALG